MDTPRFACIYCDDVRQEISGKLTFIGVYQGNMLFNEMPTTFYGLNVFMMLSYPIEETITSLRFQLESDDGIIFDLEMEKEQLEAQQHNVHAQKDEKAKFIKINIGTRIDKLVFESKTYLKSKAIVNGNEILGDGLIVTTFNETIS
jgi:hypothetical protein